MKLCTGLWLGVLAVCTALAVWFWAVGREDPVTSFVSTREMHPVPKLLQEAVKNPQALNVVHHGDPPSGSTTETTSHTAACRILILVDSQPSSFSMRAAVRASWMQHTQVGREVIVRFMVFEKGSSPSLVDKLYNESAEWKDVVIFKSADSSLHTEKLLYELLWANWSLSYHYLMKTDENYYISIDRIVNAMDSFPKDVNVFWAYMVSERRNKDLVRHSEPRWFLCDHLIKYPRSGAYIISQPLVQRLVLQANYLELYNNEGVGLSVWLSPFNDVYWKHDERFDTEVGRPRGYRSGSVVFATSSASDMVKVHKLLLNMQ